MVEIYPSNSLSEKIGTKLERTNGRVPEVGADLAVLYQGDRVAAPEVDLDDPGVDQDQSQVSLYLFRRSCQSRP